MSKVMFGKLISKSPEEREGKRDVSTLQVLLHNLT